MIYIRAFWLPAILLALRADGFSPKNGSIRRAVTLQRPTTSIETAIVSDSPLFASSSGDVTCRRKVLEKGATRFAGKRKWIRNWICRSGLPLRKGELHRVFISFALALAIWIRGPPSPSEPSFQGSSVAHAAGPVAIKFKGAAVNAHGREWQSNENGGSSDMLLPVTLKSTQGEAKKQTRPTFSVGAEKGTIVATAAGAFLVLVPVAKKLVGGTTENDNDTSVDSYVSNQENREASLRYEDDDGAKAKMATDLQQQRLAAKFVEEAMKDRKKDDKVVREDLEVSNASEVETNEMDSEKAGDSISTIKEKETPLISEVAFLGLSILSAVASIFLL